MIIPTINAGDRLGRLLEAIEEQQFDGKLEIIVIDSGSKDGTQERARKAGARVLPIPHRQFNHGWTRNQAIQACKGEFVVLTVQDALPTDEDWLARLLGPLLEQREIVGSYGLQLCPPTAGLLARARSALWYEGNKRPLVKSLETPEEYQALSPEERLKLIRFDNVTACVRRNVWAEVPFPERTFGEDVAWAKEVLLAGYKTAYVPEAQVWHCHERGWLYNLRRAYINGYTRVQLVDWPSPELDLSETFALLRRLSFFLITKRYDQMVEPAAIQRFLEVEKRYYDRLDTKPAQAYQTILRFSWRLWESAMRLAPGGVLPEEAWSSLLRFAVAAVVGEELGATAGVKLQQPTSLETVVWRMLHRFLGKGV
jgi:rhamnosyltransferase